jgi:hypothetical protein
MVLYQKIDHSFIVARQATLEAEIRSLIALGEESKNFSNRFGAVHKNKSGNFITSSAPTKTGIKIR